jgi:hypothetical protein
MVRVPGYRSRGSRFDSRRYQILWEVVGLERGPLSFVRIIEELLELKSSGSGLENRINGHGDTLRWIRDTLYPQKLALTSPTSGGRSVGIVRLRTKSHGVMSLMLLLCFSIAASVKKLVIYNRDIYVVEEWHMQNHHSVKVLLKKSIYLTHSWSRALLEKLPIVQLLKNFPAFYRTRRFITAFT